MGMTSAEKMLAGAIMKAKDPEISKANILRSLGYSENTASNCPANIQWLNSDEYRELVDILRPYYALTKLKDLDKLAEATKAIEISGSLAAELLRRIAKGELKTMPMKDLIAAHARETEIATKSVSGLSDEAKKALTSIEDIKAQTAKYLPDTGLKVVK